MSQQAPVGDRLAGQQPERLHPRLLTRVQARQAASARVHHGQALGRDGRARVDDDQGGNALGVPRRERHRVVTTHRMADDNHTRPAQHIHQSGEVRREVLGAVGGRVGPGALTVTALIQRDDVKAVGERGRDGVEPVRVRRAAVQKAERRRTRRAGFQEMQLQSVHLDDA